MIYHFEHILHIGLIITPLILAFIGLVMLLFSYRSSITNEEANRKRSLMYYFVFALGAWVGLFLFFFFLDVFYRILPLFVFFILSVPVGLYQFVSSLLSGAPTHGFKSFHYLPPLIMALATFVVEVLTPISSILQETRTAERWLLAVFSISTILYFWRITYMLYAYNLELRSTKPEHQSIIRRWILLLGTLTFVLLFSCVIPIFVSPSQYNMWIHIGALLWAVQFMVLIYNVVCKHYSVFEQINKNRQYLKGTITIPTESIPIHAIATTTTTKKVLTRKNFEEIFVKGKLYTNPNITLNDLVEQLGIDQPTLSSFIRETYNMNFRHYINTLRIQELERLLALPANAGKKPTAFIGQVGFGSIRSYQRSKSEYGKKE